MNFLWKWNLKFNKNKEPKFKAWRPLFIEIRGEVRLVTEQQDCPKAPVPMAVFSTSRSPISFPHSLGRYRAPGTQLGNEGKMWTKSYQSSWRWDLDLLDNISLDLPMKTFGEELNGRTHVQCGHHYPRLNGKQERNYQYLSPSVSWLWMKCDCHLMFLLPRPPHWSGLDALKLWTKV